MEAPISHFNATMKERQIKLTRFIFSRRFEVIITPLSSDKYLQVLEFK